MVWAQRLDRRFFSNMLLEEFACPYWEAVYQWHYMRFKQTDQYFEDMPDMLGSYCAGGEL